jgi:hypothetical protein
MAYTIDNFPFPTSPAFPKLKQLGFEPENSRPFHTRWKHPNGTTIDVLPVPTGQPVPRSQFDWRYQWTLTAPPVDGRHLGIHASGYGEMRLLGQLTMLHMFEFDKYVILRDKYVKQFKNPRLSQPAAATPGGV